MTNTQKKQLTKKEKMEKAKLLIEESGIKDELKAKAVHYSDEEAQKIIDAKKVERIKRQEAYQKELLVLDAKGTKLKYLDRDISKNIKINDNGSYDIINEKMDYLGESQYTEVLLKEYNLEVHYYKMQIANVNYAKQALENDGLTADEIKLVESGKLIKEIQNEKVNK